MIEIDHVSRSYGRKVAVDTLNLTVPPGELFAFLGPNGAGKTTTIKMLVGLLRPSSGQIRLCGQDVVQHPREAARLVGYVPDEPYLYDKLSGREFLHFIGRMHGLDEPRVVARIDAGTRIFELADFLDDLTETYSHGMKQRVVFAASLLHEPRILILDEPMVGLDPKSMRLVKNLLRAKVADGMTVFMSTHQLDMAEEVADRVAIVHQGRLRCVGSVAQLRVDLARQNSSLEQLFLEVTGDETLAAPQVPEPGHDPLAR